MMFSRHSFSAVIFFSRSILRARIILPAIAMLLLAGTSMAQQPPQAANAADARAQTSAASTSGKQTQNKTVSLPAGTRLALVLTHPVDSKSTHRGDTIYAQTTAPVAVGDQVAIPAGTFLQGQVEKLTRKGNRGEFAMQSISLIFPAGYVASVAGPVNIESGEGTAWRNPSGRAKAGAVAAPVAGLGLGLLIGSSAHTTQSSTLGGTTLTSSSPKGLAVGGLVGMAAGGAVAVALLVRSRDFYLEVSSPMEMTLPRPLTVAQNQVMDSGAQGPPETPTDHGICYTPDTPGTPPIVIPGIPATENSPGTPDTVIPGTPSIPGTPYPCP